jgi:hypothetical protein
MSGGGKKEVRERECVYLVLDQGLRRCILLVPNRLEHIA